MNNVHVCGTAEASTNIRHNCVTISGCPGHPLVDPELLDSGHNPP